MLYITNAFSITMLDHKTERYHVKDRLTVERITVGDAKRILRNNPKYISAYGHDGSLRWLNALLESNIPVSRKMIRVQEGDAVLIAAACYKTHNHKQQDNAKPFFVFYLIKSESSRGKRENCVSPRE